MRHTFCIILFALLSSTTDAGIIRVYTQQDFDHLSVNILEAIKKGEKDIVVEIEARELTFANNQISLTSVKRDDVSISIHGKGVKIMSQGHYVKKVSNPSYMYLKNGKYFNPWTDFQQLQDTISIIDKPSHLCLITTPVKNKKNKYPQNKHINYTCWYTSRTSPVKEISKKQITFDAGEWAVARNEKSLNVNMDYSYAKKYPRYRLFGTKKIKGKIYECTASTLLKLAFCNFKSFSIDSINVTGCTNENALIMVNQCKAYSITISGSTFCCIGGSVLIDRRSTNVCFTGNQVDAFVGYGIQSEAGSVGAKVTNNTFTNCTLGMTNGFAIQMRSKDFLVSGNTISDFCYGGIGVGIWAGTKTEDKCSGIVKGNELFLTPQFLSNTSQNTLMDSGAIYTWTRCDGITISQNYIHDISGMKDNRGIFLDDGTKNVTLSENKIERIENSYDIDLRWSETYKAKVPDHNTGNRMFNNKTTGKVRFETQKPKKK